MQYTIRNIPDYLDATLRDFARRKGKSLNEVAVEALVRGAGLAERERVKRDLTDIAGTWQEDAAFDNAIAEQQKIDEAMWQ
jgi:plasmid stability protein